MMDNMSSGEADIMEDTVHHEAEWVQPQKPNSKKKGKKKSPPQDTRQSMRLKGHGGTTMEELATRRKQ
jgi:hypothetical protein